jgi:hypothetical protein
MRLVRRPGVTWVGMVHGSQARLFRPLLPLRLKIIAAWLGELSVLWFVLSSEFIYAQLASVLVLFVRHLVPPLLPPVTSRVNGVVRRLALPLAAGVAWLLIGVPAAVLPIVLGAVLILLVLVILGLMYLDLRRFVEPVVWVRLKGDTARFMNGLVDEVTGRGIPSNADVHCETGES